MLACKQRRELFQKYRAATTAYADLVKKLRGAVSSDYGYMSERVQLARQKMLAAQENLNMHLSTHHCQAPEPD